MILTSTGINEEIRRNPAGYVHAVDDAYSAQLCGIAKHIFDRRDRCPIILISGPSGSGKTTTAKMIEQFLDGWGCETHTVSMDNYFLPFSPQEMELVNQGKIDLESPARLDIPLLNSHIVKMINMEPVELPMYDFANSRRLTDRTLTRRPGELVILEGIHALNPAVITVPDTQTCRIYVSVRTRIQTDGLILHPEKIRLLRRMLRDRKNRGRSIADTLSMYDNVQLGENRYIMPYKHRRTFDVDTFIAYEAGVYKQFLMDELEKEKHDPRIADLVETLEHLDPVDAACVPETSLIREFIGGGQFGL